MMRILRKILLRFRSLFNKSRVEDDLETELRDYIEREIESQIDAGATPEEARLIVTRRMQGEEQIKEECRDARGTSNIEFLVRDLRYGLRVLLKNPGFSAAASITLALGIATSTTLFSVVESQLWRPLPFPQPERLTAVWERNVKSERGPTSVSVPDFADWRRRSRIFESLAAMEWPSRRTFAANSWNQRVNVGAVSFGFLETLAVQPQFGHTFDAHKEQPGNQTLAILSSAIARKAFGSQQHAIGRTIRLDSQVYSVIGVLPDSFRLDVLRTPDVFIPLTISYAQPRDTRNLVVIGRLRPNATRAQGLAEMQAIAKEIAAEHPDTNSNFTATVENLRNTFIASSTRTWLLVFLAFSIFVLLIACCNVATLQLMRSVVRRREFALREALGASGGALFRQVIAESAWVASSGAILGIALAFAGMLVLRAMPLTGMLARESEISVNLWSIGFVVCVSVFATFLFGLAPGLLGSRMDLESSLKDSGRSMSSGPGIRRRIEYLSAAQVTLAFLSLFAAGLFAVSCRDLQHIPLGFNPRNISTFQISLSGEKYANDDAIRQFYNKVTQQASSIPGMQEFVLSSNLPLTGGMDLDFARADRPHPPRGQEPFSLARITTPGYFHVLGIPILMGRDFGSIDTASSIRVAIINHNLAEHYFSNEDPVGKYLLLRDGQQPSLPEKTVEIVGVAANARDVGLNEIPFDDVYLPASQAVSRQMYVVAKTNAASVSPLLRGNIQKLDPEQFVAEVTPLESYVAERLRGPQFDLTLIAVFAGMALLLTAVALFGTLSFTVAQQTRDIGLRIALGAARANILKMMLRQTFRLIVAGSVVGFAITVILGAIYRDRLYLVPHQHDGILYGVSIRDPFSFASAAAALILFACFAAVIPTLRAMRIDPNAALRCD